MADEQTTTGFGVSDIAEAAQNPSSFSVEGLQQSNRSIGELIKAHKFLSSLDNRRRRRHPLDGMVTHILPPSP